MPILLTDTLRRRLLDRTLLAGIGLTLLFVGVEIYTTHKPNLPLDITLATGFLLILIRHYYASNTCSCVRAALALLAFWLIASLDRGVASAVLWMPIFPLVAFFGLGRREGLIWSVAFAVLFAANAGIEQWAGQAPLGLTQTMAAVGSVILTSVFVHHYQHLVEDYQTELNDHHERLIREMTEKQRISKMHADARHELDAILSHIRDVYFHIGTDGRTIAIGGAIEDMLGYTPEEMRGRMVTEFYADPEDRGRFLEALQLAGGNLTNHEVSLRHKNGSIVWGSLSAHIVHDAEDDSAGTEGVLRNITERKEAESERLRLTQQFQRAQRLESVGILAGGIAHDFNNLLAGIMGYAELAQLDVPAGSEAADSLHNIIQSSKRASSLISQMLAYSGRGKFEIRPIDLSATILDISQLLKTVISKKAMLELDLADSPPSIEGDINQIRQVIMNLITNASDALDGKQGHIRVHTAVAKLDAGAINRMFFHEAMKPGRYVLLEVSDTGIGMSTAIIHTIFDPFFTTKRSGTGLGLAAALGIIRGHSGGIDIHSRPGLGSTFRLFFPPSDTTDPLVHTQQMPAFQPARVSAQTNGIVLVVDDEADVRDSTMRILERSGIRAMAASDGLQAVEAFRRHADEIAVVLLDLTMPRMSGADAFRAIRAIRPQAQVVLCSGYAEPDAAMGGIADGLAGFLRKPFSHRQLMDVLHQLLAPGKTGA